ncbi:MAG: IS1595 family transposase [Chloroflexi bacterium]|nr:IS1595 family transposase [Chloroflexota bacterium]
MAAKGAPKQDMNLFRLMEAYDTDSECRAALEELRWPEGATCPKCESKKISRISTRQQFDCDSCGYQFSVLAGTIFHDSKLPLPKWFMAIYLMCESRKGISANQMKRTLDVSYKTAWYLCHRIRAAMAGVDREPLTGVVEVDETFVGGKAKFMHKTDRARRVHGRGGIDKTMVLGAIQRGGDVHFRVEQRRSREVLHQFVSEHVADGAEAIYTDEHSGYDGIADGDTFHETVNHGAEEWVRGAVHTNTVEGVWSLFKRSIVGSYHQLSAKHLDAYLGEFEFRFNNRENPYLFRDTLTRLLRSENLEYRELVGRQVR